MPQDSPKMPDDDEPLPAGQALADELIAARRTAQDMAELRADFDRFRSVVVARLDELERRIALAE